MNLSELIPIERSLFILDCETTGPNSREDRIVEVGFIELKTDGTTREWSSLVNPTIPIPATATKGHGDYPGHGITDEAVAEKPTFATLAPHLLRGFKNADYAGYNIKSFDLPLLRAEFERAGHQWSYADAKILDAFRIWSLGQKRTLSDAVDVFLGHSHENAHGVIADVRASLDVLVQQLIKFQTLPHNIGMLHDLQWPRDANAIDSEGKFIWVHGVATCNFGKKFKGTPLHKVDRSYLQWMAKPEQSFPEDVKFIVNEALAGRLPQRAAEKSDDAVAF